MFHATARRQFFNDLCRSHVRFRTSDAGIEHNYGDWSGAPRMHNRHNLAARITECIPPSIQVVDVTGYERLADIRKRDVLGCQSAGHILSNAGSSHGPVGPPGVWPFSPPLRALTYLTNQGRRSGRANPLPPGEGWVSARLDTLPFLPSPRFY
jgi:hypothetical protein